MVFVDLEDFLRFDGAAVWHGGVEFFHIDGDLSLGGEVDSIFVGEEIGGFHAHNFAGEQTGELFEEGIIGFFFVVALFSVVLQTKIVAGDRAEFLFRRTRRGCAAQISFKGVGEIEHFVALVLDDANLWQAVDLVSAGAGSGVDVFLILMACARRIL